MGEKILPYLPDSPCSRLSLNEEAGGREKEDKGQGEKEKKNLH
jgi:hypothetical protein